MWKNTSWPMISIHALCEEGDHSTKSISSSSDRFLSTPSARRATSSMLLRASTVSFLSTPSARRATNNSYGVRPALMISIHALCEEGDLRMCSPCRPGSQFLSTPSARRATGHPRRAGPPGRDFYPRPLRGGRPVFRACYAAAIPISIHALCEEGDAGQSKKDHDRNYFYPRPLRGGRLREEAPAWQH